MENVICPNCGFQFPLDKSRDFCFCLKCGTKIEVPKYEEIQPEVQKVKPTEQPEVKNKTPKNEPKSKVNSVLEEVEFYYDTSFNKKEYADTENQPTYYLKAQDLLIDLSTEFETDWRIWWEVSKPIDYKCTEFTEECRPYTVNDMYFQRAVDYAPIEQKKELIKLGDEYKERKEKFFKKFDEQAQKRKAEEQERQRIANSLQAWWVTKHGSSEGAQWGIVLYNEGEVYAVFYNLRITLVIKDTTHTIDCEVVPPGRFFIACNLDRQNTTFPEPIKSEYTYEPIMRSSKHQITAMSFRDRTGTRWRWTPDAGAEKQER